MTPSHHMPQIQIRQPDWPRGRRPGMDDERGVADPGDIATVSFEVDAGDRPTTALEAMRPRATPAQTTQPEGSAAFRDVGPGSVLRGRYLIEKAIGAGGTSTVFSALDRHRYSARANGHGSEEGNPLHGFAHIALKILRADAGANDARVFRMEREFRQMQRLTHTGIVRVFDLDCENNLWFITMELLEGQPLHRYLRTGLKDAETLSILTQCAEALAYAHDQGIVHGDLKPGNVFIVRDGAVRLFDFGSAPDLREVAEPATARRFAATPPYASPETLEGKGVEQRDDIFSLGCLAYELLSGGRHPFDGKSSLDARQQGLRPQYVDGIRPRHFAAVIRALAWDRAARPASVREFLQAFTASENRRETLGDSRVAAQRADASALTGPLTPPSIEAIQVSGELDAKPEPAPEEPATAEPPPMADFDDPPTRKFAGFVPEEMLAKMRRAPEPVKDLQVAGLTEESPWLKRTIVMALLAAALLVGFFVLERKLPTETAMPVVMPPAVAAADVINAALPPPAPVAEEVAQVAASPPPAPVVRAAPGEVSFESATVNVSPSQSMAVVNIARLKSTQGAAPIVWSTVAGTARPGVHYESVDAAVARFNDGQSVRSLFIPLKTNPAEVTRPARSFIVKLEKATGGPALGAITQAKVVVAGIE